MSFWKTKVVPKFKKVFEKDTAKKLVATEACTSFNESKEEITKELDEKRTDLAPKVIKIYEATTVEIKGLIKDPKEKVLKKHSAAVHTLFEKLVEIEFPGSKAVCEASSKVGPALLPGPVFFVFEKVSSFIVVEEPAPEEPAAPAAEPEAPIEHIETKDKEIVIESATEKKEDEPPVVLPLKVEEPETAPTPKAEEPETALPLKAEEPETTPPPKAKEPETAPTPKTEEPKTAPPAEEPKTAPTKA